MVLSYIGPSTHTLDPFGPLLTPTPQTQQLLVSCRLNLLMVPPLHPSLPSTRHAAPTPCRPAPETPKSTTRIAARWATAALEEPQAEREFSITDLDGKYSLNSA